MVEAKARELKLLKETRPPEARHPLWFHLGEQHRLSAEALR